jgi:hypothetical protein
MDGQDAYGGRGHARNPGGLAEGKGSHPFQLIPHFNGEATDRIVIESGRDRHLFSPAKSLYLL